MRNDRAILGVLEDIKEDRTMYKPGGRNTKASIKGYNFSTKDD